MRTPKESATIVAKTINKINSVTKGVYGKEKLEVIHNVCNQYKINANHILTVGDFTFQLPKRNQ